MSFKVMESAGFLEPIFERYTNDLKRFSNYCSRKLNYGENGLRFWIEWLGFRPQSETLQHVIKEFEYCKKALITIYRPKVFRKRSKCWSRATAESTFLVSSVPFWRR